MKKRILVALLLSGVTLSVFGNGGTETSGVADRTELNFWSWRTEDVEVYNQLIDIFEAENPDINVTFTAYKNTEYNTVLSAAIKGGSGPDIFHLRSYGGMETYAKPGYLMPLEDRIPELKDFTSNARGGVTSINDGKIYGVPFASQTLVVYYNKGMYDDLGLNPPKSWAEFLKNLKVMKDAGITPLANGGKDGWTLEVLQGVICPNFYGANDFFNDVVDGKKNFADPAYRKSLEKLLELRTYMPENFMGVSYTDMQMMFVNEMAGHFIGGSWEAGYFSSQNPDLDFDVIAGPPENTGDAAYVSSFVDGSFGMSASTKSPDAATRFLRFMASTEAGQFLANNLRQKSDVPGVVFDDPFLKKIGKLNKHATPYIMLVGFRYEQPTGSTLLQNALQGMLSDNISSRDAVNEIQEGVATWYKPFQK